MQTARVTAMIGEGSQSPSFVLDPSRSRRHQQQLSGDSTTITTWHKLLGIIYHPESFLTYFSFRHFPNAHSPALYKLRRPRQHLANAVRFLSTAHPLRPANLEWLPYPSTFRHDDGLEPPLATASFEPYRTLDL
jgi:hypothetical protein